MSADKLIYNKKLISYDNEETHGHIWIDDLDDKEVIRGRIWTDIKVISFWQFDFADIKL